MTAKEFYELNKGQYFMYDGKKVKLVGVDVSNNRNYVIITYPEGWTIEGVVNNFSINFFIDFSLCEKESNFYHVNSSNLIQIEQTELDLCEILKGCEGMVFYSTMVGYCRLIEVTKFITIDYVDDGYVVLESDGKFSAEGECTLFPSKENRDWSTFEKPIKIKEGDPVMTKWDNASFWKLESYTKDNKSDFIVPVSDFDFTDFDSNKSKSIV